LLIQLTVRLSEDLHTKIKVISVYENTTINAMITEALQERADLWEQKHGRLPTPG
jgi:predicted HicB family RNase H-like nuclease